jgi:hypothetical protein
MRLNEAMIVEPQFHGRGMEAEGDTLCPHVTSEPLSAEGPPQMWLLWAKGASLYIASL